MSSDEMDVRYEIIYGYHIKKNKTFYESIKKEFKKNNKLAELRPSAYQIFLKTPQRKALSKIKEDDKIKSKAFIKENNIKLFVHTGYLFNIGDVLKEYAINTGVDDILNGDAIGSRGAVFHVGKHCNRCTPEECRENMINYINTVIRKTLDVPAKFILETGANCGTEVCRRLEDLKYIYDNIEHKDKFGFCIDTCHIFAAGFDIRSNPMKYIKDFDDLIGLKKVELIHLNDSKGELGSHLDRHQSLSKGLIGKYGLQTFIKKFSEIRVPLVLETPAIKDLRLNDQHLIRNWKFE